MKRKEKMKKKKFVKLAKKIVRKIKIRKKEENQNQVVKVQFTCQDQGARLGQRLVHHRHHMHNHLWIDFIIIIISTARSAAFHQGDFTRGLGRGCRSISSNMSATINI